MKQQQQGSKTSIQILEERNALDSIVKKIEDEIDLALNHPEISFLVLCRVSQLLRQTRALDDGDDSSNASAAE